MLMLDKPIVLEVVRTNLQTCRRAGLADAKIGDVVEIPPDKLARTSLLEVWVKCDYCGKEYKIKNYYYNYNRKKGLIAKDACEDCRNLKCAEGHKSKYGVEWPSQRFEVKERIKETVQERYGVDNVFQNAEVKEKIVATNIAKYGAPYFTMTDDGKQKSLETFKLHYGEDPYNSELVKARRRATCLDRYGVEYGTQSSDIRQKVCNTLMERYGVSNPMGVPEFAQRAKENRTTPHFKLVSTPQKVMYETLLELGYNAHIEYKVSWGWFDVAVFLDDGQKIDFEYDGIYWHSLPGKLERDFVRDQKSFNDGWKVVRFKGSVLPPSKDEIQAALTALVGEDQQFYSVELAG